MQYEFLLWLRLVLPKKTIYALMEIFRELTLCSSIGIPFWQNGGITAFAL